MKYVPSEVAWAAGLFEGEGWFTPAWDRRAVLNAPRSYPRAGIAMTDKDVVERFARIVGFGYAVFEMKTNAVNRKPMWQWNTRNFEHVQAVIAMFWPWLGERRRAKAKEILRDAAVPVKLGKTCKRGHLRTLDNTVRNGSNARTCLLCRRNRSKIVKGSENAEVPIANHDDLSSINPSTSEPTGDA